MIGNEIGGGAPIQYKEGFYDKTYHRIVYSSAYSLNAVFSVCANRSAETVVEVTPVEDAPEGAQLTVDEYREALKDIMNNYVAVLNAVPLDAENDTVAKMKPHWEEVRESCRKCNEALDEFGTVNPPETLVERHKKLLEGVNNEKEYVAAMERFLTAKNDKELKKILRRAGKAYRQTRRGNADRNVFGAVQGA